MAKSNIPNTTKVLLPALAIAVLGLAAMVGVTLNLQKTLDPSSQASGGSCMSTAHILDKDFVGRHFSAGGSKYDVRNDVDGLTITQPDASAQASSGLKYDQKMNGDYTASVNIREIEIKEDGGLAELMSLISGNNPRINVGVRKFKDGTSYAFAQHYLNNQWDTSSRSTQKKMKFPVTVKIERKGSSFTYSFKENGGKFETLRANDDVTANPIELMLLVSNQPDQYPEVKATFSDFIVRCN